MVDVEYKLLKIEKKIFGAVALLMGVSSRVQKCTTTNT